MATLTDLLDHIRRRDEYADAAVGALVDFLEQQAPPAAVPDASRNGRTLGSPARLDPDRARWNEVIDAVAGLLADEPEHPSLVYALGRSHDERAHPVLERFTLCYLADPVREELFWQALIGLLNFDDAPQDILRRVAEGSTSERGRELATRELELLASLPS